MGVSVFMCEVKPSETCFFLTVTGVCELTKWIDTMCVFMNDIDTYIDDTHTPPPAHT